MAIGVPAIATNYGTACNIINSGQNGFLVNNKDEWVALDSSYRNPTRKGLRIANKLATVDMLELPIQNPEAVQ